MKRYNLYLQEKQIEILEKLSESSFSVSEHIRIAIDLYIKKLQRTNFSESPKRKEDHGTNNKSGNK
jgi:hypothetical protein